MSEVEELRRRLEALEGEVDRLREENAATRTLASMADRDVAEMRAALRAHTQTLGALRETQLDQSRTLDAHGTVLEGHGRTLRTIADAVGTLVTGQAALAEAVERLSARPPEPGTT
ncbi:hypothetical protein [Wenjunlia tyrosinilytica]|uniref:Uncharacterized protein n=1 Tax=Wenjunlia tyrosinilytica TaxID=1544741 RepID=A0A917ZXF2_9ACTN|nr:hypothetical protein [Wenjunlia tyrosinilytica]GGP00289.1 hypothetical protein GCM10012280_68720 [Wenjunlia tyrosinilytica]